MKFLSRFIFGLAICLVPLSHGAEKKAPCCEAELKAAAPLSDRSLYQLDSKWTADTREVISLSTLRGRPQIVVMFFASCAYACPILVHDLKRIEAALPMNIRTNVGITLISIDPERDTPAALAGFRKKNDLGPNWTLLTSGADDILEVAALLGVKFKKESNGQFAHSNLVTLLNEGGEISYQLAGLNNDPALVAAAVQKLFKAGGT